MKSVDLNSRHADMIESPNTIVQDNSYGDIDNLKEIQECFFCFVCALREAYVLTHLCEWIFANPMPGSSTCCHLPGGNIEATANAKRGKVDRIDFTSFVHSVSIHLRNVHASR